MVLEINGEEFTGVAVPKRAKIYKIKVKAKGKIDMITYRSCHRDDSFEKPKTGWGSKYSHTYIYDPVVGVENGRGCLLDIGAFEKKKGRNSWATVDFDTEIENLPAVLKCNGKKLNTKEKSVSICQARTGTIQKIKFKERVKVNPDNERCSVMKTNDELTYTFTMPLNECTYYFGTRHNNFHRLTTIGYESILIRDL